MKKAISCVLRMLYKIMKQGWIWSVWSVYSCRIKNCRKYSVKSCLYNSSILDLYLGTIKTDTQWQVHMDCQCLLMFSAFLMLMTTNNALMYILKMLIFLYFVKVSHFTLKKIHMCKLESYTQILSSHRIHLYNILLHVWWPIECHLLQVWVLRKPKATFTIHVHIIGMTSIESDAVRFSFGPSSPVTVG